MTATAHPEQQQHIFICSVSTTSDIALKQFLTSSKTVFSQTQFICPMKSAIDLAIKGKPPVIKPIQGDVLNMPGNLLSLVVSNWLNSQLRKPPPKAPSKRPTSARKNIKANPSLDLTTGEPTVKGPFIVFILDYPRTVEQYQDVIVNYHAPIYCHLSIDSGPPLITDRKANTANLYQNISIELKQALQSELVFFDINMNLETPFEQQLRDIIPQLYSVFNGSNDYKSFYSDACYVTIPPYPEQPILMPILPAEKPGKNRLSDGTKGSAPMASAVLQMQPPLIHMDALKIVFKALVLSEINNFIKSSALPYFSTNFKHYAEKFPKFPLPASLAQDLAIRPNLKAKEIFLMRNAADRNNMDYETIFRVLMKKKFEEVIGYKVTDRNVKEFLTLEILPNVIAHLSEEFSEFKAFEFGGKLLLAFYHKIPDNLPIHEFNDTYHLPTYCGFGKFYKEHGPYPSEPNDKNHPNDIGINVGRSDLFVEMDSDETKTTSTHYFCESGLRVVTYQPQIGNGYLEKLHFNLSYCQNERFSFILSQNPMPPSNEEEEEDSVETITSIRGVLSKNTEFFFDHSNEKVHFIIERKNIKIEFNITNQTVVISGLEGESHRIITSNGSLIRYTPLPTIYYPDGSISQLFRDDWRMVGSNGKGYVKRGDKWFYEPKYDTTSNTISTHFTTRKVTNRSDGFSIIEDDKDVTLAFPDGTKYNKNTKTFTCKKLPAVTVNNGSITVDFKEFVAVFGEKKDCSMTMKNQNCTVTFNEELRHLLIVFGQAGIAMTMIDLLTGSIAHVGSKRLVYYLSDEWKWILGKQLCSKKEIIQHFQEGDFIERVQPIEKIEREEIENIISNGHNPRLFIVDKDFDDFNVFELLDDNAFKTISEQSMNYSPKNTEKFQTLWFDTKPKSFREVIILPKITNEITQKVEKIMEEEKIIQDNNSKAKLSTTDPKWRDAEQKQEDEEEQMKKLYEKYEINLDA